MKFMISTYASQADYDAMTGKPGASPSWSTDDFASMARFMGELNAELAGSGELVETRGLSAPVLTRRVRHANDGPLVSDGPFAESQEVLAGYWIVECESIDRASEIAGKLSGCPAPEEVRVRAYADVRPIEEHMPEPGA